MFIFILNVTRATAPAACVGKGGSKAMEISSVRLREGVALGTLAALLLATPVLAQQQNRGRTTAPASAAEAPVLLDQITVEGAAPGQALVAGPTTTRTTREQLDRQQVQSLSDLSTRVEAGITFNRQNNSLNIRGLDGARVLTTVDGIRQPFLIDTRINRSGGTAFDFDSLSTLDLLRGPSGGSTIGAGSLGGVLAVRTLDPEDLIRNGRSYGALAKTGFDSADQAVFGSAAAAARFNNTWALIQGGFRNGHETDSGGTVKTIGAARTAPNPRDFDQYSFLAKIYQYSNDQAHRFGLTAETFKRSDRIDNRDNSVSLTGNYRPGAYRTGEDVQRDRVSLSYDYKMPGSFFDEAHAVAYWQRLKRNDLTNAYRYTSIVGLYARDNENEETAYGFNGHVIKNFNTGMLTHKVIAGTELRVAPVE